MADLLTHALLNWSFGATLLRGREGAGWLTSGAFLPDLASRVPVILLMMASSSGLLAPSPAQDRLRHSLELAHTPAGAVAVSLLLAALLPGRLAEPLGRWRAAALLGAGAMLHLVVDLLQRHILPSYAYLYPLTARRFELGWIGSEDSLLALPPLLLLAFLLKRSGRPRGTAAARED